MKNKNTKPIFTNDQDPDVVTPLPEVMPMVEAVKPEDDEKTQALKAINIDEDDLLFVKKCKEEAILTSDKTERLWHIHLKLYLRFPSPDDKYCGGCVSKAMEAVWSKCEPIYGKYYSKIIS